MLNPITRCIIAIVGVLLLTNVGYSQTIEQAEYFIDVDPGPGQGNVLPITTGTTSIQETFFINTDTLAIGRHDLYIRSKDNTGIWSQIKNYSIYVQDTITDVAFSDPRTIEAAEYFIDTDPGLGSATPLPIVGSPDNITETFTLNTAGLEFGSHKLYIRTQDNMGFWSHNKGYNFYVQDTIQEMASALNRKLIAAEYFVDQDPGINKGTAIPVNRGDSTSRKFSISTAGFETGEHFVYVRTQDETGLWSLSSALSFDVTATEDQRYAIPSFSYDTVPANQPTTFINTSDSVDAGSLYYWDILNDSTVDYNTEDIAHTFSNSGFYEVKLTVVNDTLSTSYIGTVIVGDFANRAISADGPLAFCEGDSVVLTAPVGYSYIWNTGDTTQTIHAKTSDTYFAWLIDANGVQVKSEVANVVVTELANASVNTYPESTGLSNGIAQVTINGLTSGITYEWSSSSRTTSYLDSLSAGGYTVTVTNGACPVVIPFNIGSFTPGPEDIVAAEYFLDTDPGPENGSPVLVSAGSVVQSVFPFSTDGLAVGQHQLYIRSKTNNGLWSQARKFAIYVQDTVQDVSFSDPRTIESAEYFIDSDPGAGQGIPLSITGGQESIDETFTLNTSEIDPGTHKLHIRTKDQKGIWSQEKITTFYVQDTIQGQAFVPENNIIAAEYFIDSDPGISKGKPIPVNRADSVSGKFSISTAGFTTGEHYVYVRTQDENGLWSISKVMPLGVYPSEDDRYAIPSFSYDTVPPGQPTTFINTSDSVDANTVYSWDILNDGSVEYTTQDITHTFSSSGLYEVKLTAVNDTLSTFYLGTVIVGDFSNRTITADGPLTFCEGDSVGLTGPAGYSYIWNTRDTTESIQVYESGTYYAWLIDASGLQIRSEGVRVEVTKAIDAYVTSFPETNGQSNGSAQVIVNGLKSGISYLWDSSPTTASFLNGLSAGSYSVTLSKGVCQESLPFTIGTYAPGPDDLVAAEYFWDVEPGPGNGEPLLVSGGATLQNAFSIDIDTLDVGEHFLYVRSKANNGIWSQPLKSKVYVQDTVTDTSTETELFLESAEYFIDTDPGIGNGIALGVPPSSKSFTDQVSLDVTALADGTHTFNVRTQADNGQWSVKESVEFQICQTIPPAPVANDTLFVCPGDSPSLSVTGDVGNTFAWYREDSTIISGATATTYFIGAVDEPTTYFAAQISPAGCQSAWKEIAVIPDLTQVYAGVDEEIYYQGPDFQLKGFFPVGGTWTGGIVNSSGLISRSTLTPGTYTLTYTYANGGCSIQDTRTIEVTDVLNGNVPPDVTDQLLSVEENSLNGTLIGTIVSSDLNGDSLSYAIVSGNVGNTFAIDSLSGDVTVQDSLLLDYESTPQFIMGIDVSDPLVTVSINLTIDVLPVNELLSVKDSIYSVDQTDPNGTSIGFIEASDPDNDALTFTITGGNVDGAFSIDASTGEILLIDNSVLDTDVTPQYDLVISVSDLEFVVDANATVNIYSLKRDRLALIAFQEATNSTLGNWGGAVLDNTWQGVFVENGRLRNLKLPDAGLVGVVPSEFLDLTGLDTIDLSQNQLSGFPNVSNFPNLDYLDVSDNQLGIVELLNNSTIPNYFYAPQADFGVPVTDRIPAGSDSLLRINSSSMIAPQNTYQWYFEPHLTEGFVPIPNADSVAYDILAIDFDQMGSYYVEIKNPALPDLTIKNNPVTILAETEITGTIFKEGSTPLAGGLVDVYRIESGPYTLEDSAIISQEGVYRFDRVVLGDFIVKVTPEEEDSVVLQTHYISQQDWVDADTLFLRQKAEQIDIQMLPNPGNFDVAPGNTGFLIGLLEDQTNSSGRIDARRKVKKAGCSLRRRTRSGGGRGNQQEDEFVLVAYVETDDDGNFSFSNIPPGYYRINIQYPGVPMDESSQIEFEISAEFENTGFQLNASITDEAIIVNLEEILGNLKPFLKNTMLYPNPVDEVMNIDYLVYRKMESLIFEVIDLKGNTLYHQELPHQMGNQSTSIELKQFGSGVYFIRLSANEGFYDVIRFIKK